MRLPNPAKGVEHREALVRQNRIEQHFAGLDLPSQQFFNGERHDGYLCSRAWICFPLRRVANQL